MNPVSQLAQRDDGGIRKALYLDMAEYHPSNIDSFHFDDWALDRVTSSPRAKACIHDYHYLVGIVYLSHLSDLQRQQVMDIVSREYNTIWIALIEHNDLLDANFQHLICANFHDYFTLPLDNNLNYLKAALGHAYGIALLRSLESQGTNEYEQTEMVGSSEPMRRVFSEIRKVANVDAPVMIGGDTGTGKEMVARAIHQRSARHDGPFIAVNCGALPDTLIHAELFGHEKGAFTGAYKRKIGRIEAAQNGTIFLDEIGDLPLELQVYLLRFLEERTIERLGGNESLRVNARVIAATHVDLEKAVEEGRFREDLYYRLNVLNIQMPTLSERYEDIELLARYFLRKFSQEYDTRVQGFSGQAVEAMNKHHWPGNIREMINRIRRALVMGENRLITPSDLGLTQAPVSLQVMSLEEARDHAEELAVKSGLHYSHHNITKTAKILGVSRVTLYRLIDKYGLKKNVSAP